MGLGFTSVGWRWPIIAAGVLVSLGTLFVVFADGGRIDGLKSGIIGFSVAVVALALGHSWSTHPALVISLRTGVAIQALGQALILAFLLFFKMNRLF